MTRPADWVLQAQPAKRQVPFELIDASQFSLWRLIASAASHYRSRRSFVAGASTATSSTSIRGGLAPATTVAAATSLITIALVVGIGGSYRVSNAA